MSRRGDQERTRAAGALVQTLLERRGMAGAVREHRLVTEWPEIVGKVFAQRARPTSFRRGVLLVQVVSSAWMQELSFVREALVRRCNQVVGGEPPLVKEVRFHLPGSRAGTVAASDEEDVVAALARRQKKPARAAPRPRVEPRPEDVARIEAETGKVQDPELRRALRALRLRLGL